jgi:pyruvate,water dikinase
LAAHSARAFDGPQDLEWAADDDALHLLQARPITTLPPSTGIVFGPGPVAESFPDALSPLEQDLWLDPMRDGLREALRLAGATPPNVLRRSPLLIAVDGIAAVDLAALGADGRRGGLWRKLDPRPPARRLRAAWRVGRLRSALPELALDLVDRVDAELAAVPALNELDDRDLLAVLRNGRRALVSLHGHEALAGLLIPAADAATVTGSSLALAAAARARAEGIAPEELVEQEPVVLALVPPRIGPSALLEVLAGAPAAAATSLDGEPPDRAAVAREALRLRIRWTQELMARAAWELGARLADRGQLRTRTDVREIRVEELAAAVSRRLRVLPPAAGAAASRRTLPSRFRLDDGGRPWAVAPTGRRTRRNADEAMAVGAGGGRVTAPVHVIGDGGEIPAGSILVVDHLDPRLATVIPRLAGLVAATGSPLSHLAILAREHGVATVVGVTDAATRFHSGDIATVDGHEGTVVAGPFSSGLVEAGVAA